MTVPSWGAAAAGAAAGGVDSAGAVGVMDCAAVTGEAMGGVGTGLGVVVPFL